LITPFDTSLPGGAELAGHLEKGDGAIATGLQIASAEQTARDLRAAGMNINGPTPGTLMRRGDKEPPPPLWWLITFSGPQLVDPSLASRPLFLIQYATRPTGAPAMPRPTNPNSASSLSELLIAVNNLPNAIAGYGMIGKVRAEEITLPEFGAVGKEIVLERGSILLMRATPKKAILTAPPRFTNASKLSRLRCTQASGSVGSKSRKNGSRERKRSGSKLDDEKKSKSSETR
jgi:hypothetical protein